MVEEFYFGIGDGSSKRAIEKLAPRKLNIMINYASKVRAVPRNTERLFVDSGGFSFFYKLNGYPDAPINYLRFVYRVKADYFANRDFPTLPFILERLGMTVREAQMKTIENQITLMGLIEDYYPKLKPKFVAVLQGWTLDDYLFMLDYMREHGLLTKRIGLGSMVRKGKEKALRKYIVAIREELPRKYQLHGFGIKFKMLSFKEVWEALYSVDSLAYKYPVRREWLKGVPVQKKLEMAILEWISKYETLKALHSTQTTLTVFNNKTNAL